MNELKMDLQQSIRVLTQQGWSQRKIARELGIDRETVARHRRLTLKGAVSKPAIPPPGSTPPTEPQAVEEVGSKPAMLPAGRRSQCAAFRDTIVAKLELGLSAQRIYQDLVSEHQFAGGSDSVKRFVAKMGSQSPLPFRRMECLPGEEAQVDYGQGAWVVEDG
ncbi:MAG: helix-turn-helix domain-containing protein [Verrucomicrobiales bacterium]|nr:helix-turn-helix domain-containing protein [Verrucomicrobiales bacterium]